MPERKSDTDGTLHISTLSFASPGPQNTEETLEWAARKREERDVNFVLVATTSGDTAVKALKFFDPRHFVAVTHSTGFAKANFQQLEHGNRLLLEEKGVKILTCQHAFGGVGRAVRKKLGTYELEEIIAYTLRTFGQGTKVAVEISLMAADAGLVRAGEPCIAIGGTETGADTALLLRPSNAQTFFDLEVMEVLAKPR